MSGSVRWSALPHIAQDGEELDFTPTQNLRPFPAALQIHTSEDGFSETGAHFFLEVEMDTDSPNA